MSPGNPFKKPYRGGNTSASVKSPQRVSGTKKNVPTPKSPIGKMGKSCPGPKVGSVRVTRHTGSKSSMPGVRQGAKLD